ncbi:sporulation protein YqfC [Clostridium sp.]|uniref:sporulation protein YqfC n=1 Tax=Clostridium sp. TaxID=1506 RepID=UPI0032170DCD
MNNKLARVKEKVVYGLDLPVDVALSLPKITILAEKEITVENHKGIIKFNTNELVINTTLGLLEILGENFEIIFVGGTTITLTGKFRTVVYENYEENK